MVILDFHDLMSWNISSVQTMYLVLAWVSVAFQVKVHRHQLKVGFRRDVTRNPSKLRISCVLNRFQFFWGEEGGPFTFNIRF